MCKSVIASPHLPVGCSREAGNLSKEAPAFSKTGALKLRKDRNGRAPSLAHCRISVAHTACLALQQPKCTKASKRSGCSTCGSADTVKSLLHGVGLQEIHNSMPENMW